MANEKEKDAKAAAAAPAAADAAPKKKLPLKTIIVVAVVMVVEAAAVIGIFSAIKPKSTHAAEHSTLENDDGETLKEVQVSDEKYQNMKGGDSWVWQVAVTIQVKKKHSAKVEGVLKARGAEISDGLRQIVGNADPSQLKEPDSRTLNRQFTAYLNKMIGVDEKSNEPLIEKVLIPKCLGFAANF